MIRMAMHQDIPRLTEIHSKALPNDLLPRLGKDFLRTIFFPCILSSTQAFTLAYTDENDQVLSFVTFSFNSRLLTNELMRNKIPIIFSILKQIFDDPLLSWDVFISMASVRQEYIQPIGFSICAIPELYLIATHPSQQSRGLGSEIVRGGLRILAEKGFSKCLVKTSAEGAKKFYRHLDFQEIGVEYRGKRSLTMFLKEIN